jgi:hypothetical protein
VQIKICGHTASISRRRAASAALVLALHIAIVAMLLEMTLGTREARLEPEAVVTLEQRIELKPPPRHGAPSHGASGSAAITAPLANPPMFAPPDVSAIGDVLFNCRPERLDMLSVEQRARCKLALGGPQGNRWTAFKPPPSESQYAELWQKAIKDRETPVRVPCASVSGGKASIMTPDGRPMGGPPAEVKPGIGVDYVCIALRLWQALNR